MKKIVILAVTVAILVSGCSAVLRKMYGIRELKGFNEEEYDDFIAPLEKKYNFSTIISDTIQYESVIELGTTFQEKNDFGQPVQVLYFENDVIKSFHPNCYAKGTLSNLNWNTEQRFSVFIPKTAAAVDSLKVNLQDYINIYPSIERLADKKYTILIFWTQMMSKISKSAIETVSNNLEEFEKEEESSIILINSDKFFSSID